MENKIYFKLGVVECDRFNYSMNIFNKKMSLLIDDDVNSYCVIGNEKEGFKLFYNKHQYDVVVLKNDKKANSCLKELVQITDRCKKEFDEEKKVDSDYDATQELIKTAKKAIVNENLDKSIKLENINKDYSINKTKIFRDTGLLMKKVFYGKYYLGLSVTLRSIGSLGLIVSAIIQLLSGNPIWLLIFGGGLVTIFDTFIIAVTSEDTKSITKSYRGLIFFVLSIALSPLFVGYNIARKLIENLVHNHRVKKVNETITDTDATKTETYSIASDEKIKEAINIIEGKVVDNEKTIRPQMTNVEIEELSNKINLLKDKDTRVKNRNKLIEIVKYYYESLKNFKENDRNKLFSNVLNEIFSISKDVDKDLAKEEENDLMQRGYYKLMSEIKDYRESISHDDFQKTIGTKRNGE